MPFPRPPRKKPVSSEAEETQRGLHRPTAGEIYEQVLRSARHELDRPGGNLAVSGFACGILMGLTGLSVGIVLTLLGSSTAARLIADCFYPIGFIAVILGRAQLFTENTLYPVALALAEKGHVLKTLWLWAIVLPSNILGAYVFALLAVRTTAVRPQVVAAMSSLGMQAASPSWGHVFWSAVFGGWIIATVAWLVSSSHSITGSLLLIWILAFVVGAGGFAHCIASSGEILASVLYGALPASRYFYWLLPATLGNIAGGVVLVTLLEYGQVSGDDQPSRR